MRRYAVYAGGNCVHVGTVDAVDDADAVRAALAAPGFTPDPAKSYRVTSGGGVDGREREPWRRRVRGGAGGSGVAPVTSLMHCWGTGTLHVWEKDSRMPIVLCRRCGSSRPATRYD